MAESPGTRLAVVTENSMREHSLNIVDLDAGKFLLPPSIHLPGPVQATWKVIRHVKDRTRTQGSPSSGRRETGDY